MELSIIHRDDIPAIVAVARRLYLYGIVRGD